MDIDALEAAGLHDPSAPDAEERLELLRHLLERGADEQLIRGRLAAGDELFMVATSLTRSWPSIRSVRELAESTNIDVEAVARMRTAMGFSASDLDTPSVRYTLDEDVELFGAAAELYGEDRVLAFTRVLGSAAVRIADAANALFGEAVGEQEDRRPSMLAMSLANEEALAVLEQVPAVLGRAVIEHLQVLLQRLTDVIDHGTARCTIGFVDLVESTSWATSVAVHEHSQALARFETAAWDAAIRHGGRVVKMIGDEAMFVATDPETAARIATDLVASARADEVLPVARGAIGEGEVTTRAGDYFGPLVNAVARATKVADPGAVVVLAPTDEVLRARGWDLGESSKADLRGLAEPVSVVTLGSSLRS